MWSQNMDIGLLEDIFTDVHIIPRAVFPLHKTYFCELIEMDTPLFVFCLTQVKQFQMFLSFLYFVDWDGHSINLFLEEFWA